MKLLAINFASNVEESVRFYQALGLNLDNGIEPVWTELNASGGVLAVHASHKPEHPGRGLEVCLVAECPLEEVQEKLVAAGFDGGRIQEEDFGRSLRVVDPDGNDLQINDR